MNLPIATRYALRSLLRHRRRSVLSAVGIAVGCSVCMFMVGFVRGEGETIMRAAAESGSGHLRFAPKGWRETGNDRLRLPAWQELLDLADRVSGVLVACPHARSDALLAMGTRTAGVIMLGVDAQREMRANRLVQKVTNGRYLRPNETGAVVIGGSLAERLDVGVEDDLMVTVSAQDGEMQSAMLRVVGIVDTGSKMLDTALCHVSLRDVAELTGHDRVGEISVLLADADLLPQAIAEVTGPLGAQADIVTWLEIIPELASGVEVDETWAKIMVTIVTLVVFLGIASAQLAAVLERRREFAVLAALGMKGGRLVRIMLTEGVILGVTGGVLALFIGLPTTYLSATRGIDFRGWSGGADYGISNILLEPVVYGDFGWWLVPLALGLAVVSTTLSSLYPAWYALHTDPASALRVDQ